MADSNITQKALASALKELMEETPFTRIRIADICEKCEMNRKSFYYHFKDKYDLVNWIFDSEFIYPAKAQRFSSGWQLLTQLCLYLDDNRDFYRRAFKIEGQNSFSEFFHRFINHEIAACLEKMVDDREQRNFEISFFTFAVVGMIESWIAEPFPHTPETFMQLLKSCMQRTALRIYHEMDSTPPNDVFFAQP